MRNETLGLVRGVFWWSEGKAPRIAGVTRHLDNIVDNATPGVPHPCAQPWTYGLMRDESMRAFWRFLGDMMAPERIAITGANGFIGSALCASTREVGWLVREITRQPRKAAMGPSGAAAVDSVTVGEIDATTNWEEALRGCDVVIHLAAHQQTSRGSSAQDDSAFERVNVLGTLNLATQAAAAGVKRFVFLSTVKIYGEPSKTGGPWIETSQSNPQDPYGRTKWRAETALREAATASAMEWVVIRPPVVYGPGKQPSNMRDLARCVALGVPLPLGAIENRLSMVSILNLTNFILLCTTHPNAANQIFLISDDRDISVQDFIRKMAVCLDMSARLVPVPVRLLRSLAMLAGKTVAVDRLTGDLQVDISKAKALLGWRPPYTVEDGLRHFLRGEIDKKVV